MISKIKNNKYFKTIVFFIYEGIYLIFIDFFNQYLITRSLSVSEYFVKTAIVFNILWVLLYFIILYAMNPKPRKIISCIINILLLILSIVNYFMNFYEFVFSFNIFMEGFISFGRWIFFFGINT